MCIFILEFAYPLVIDVCAFLLSVFPYSILVLYDTEKFVKVCHSFELIKLLLNNNGTRYKFSLTIRRIYTYKFIDLVYDLLKDEL